MLYFNSLAAKKICVHFFVLWVVTFYKHDCTEKEGVELEAETLWPDFYLCVHRVKGL